MTSVFVSQRVYDTVRFAILETCLALTIFRAELSPYILSLFVGLLMLKAFHVLLDTRVENVRDRQPHPPLHQLYTGCMQFERHAQQVQLEEAPEFDSRHSILGHIRFLGLAAVLLVANIVTLALFYVELLQHGPSVVLLFLFEVAVLLLALILCVYRYILFTIAQRVEQATGVEWHNHSLYLMVGKLFVNTCKLLVLAGYFGTLLAYYGMPFLMVRDLWRAFDAVVRDVGNLSATIKLRAEVSQRFFAPTQEEIDANGELDPIFHTPLTPDTALKLPCGHILNQAGLMSWWQQQRNCPLCRYNILQADPPAYVRERRRRRQGLPPAAVQDDEPADTPAPQAAPADAAVDNNDGDAVQAAEQMPTADTAQRNAAGDAELRRRPTAGHAASAPAAAAAADQSPEQTPSSDDEEVDAKHKARSKKKAKSSKKKHRSSRRSSPSPSPQHGPFTPGPAHAHAQSPWMPSPMHPHSPWTPPPPPPHAASGG